MAWFIECPFCHKSVFRWFYSWHESKHTERRPDGQMNEHVTLAPALRFEGSLDGVPKAYQHSKCGVATGMPEEIIRTYLVAPLTYNDSSFCCGCGDYVTSAHLTWLETGETVMSYMARLRADHLRSLNVDPTGREIVFTPGTADALRGIASENYPGVPFYIALSLVRTDLDVQYKIDISNNWDQYSEALIEADGIKVIVPKKQRDRLKGTVIHFNSGPRTGLVVARLTPWSTYP